MKIGVYGLGRFGQFWAGLLAGRHEVVAYNRSQKSPPAGVRLVDLAGLVTSDTIYLCVSISSLSEVLDHLAPLIRPGTLVADTCSVKVHPVEQMIGRLPNTVEILATHPMFGPDSARGGVKGLPIIVYPVRVAQERFQGWRAEFSAYGLRVVELDPDAHDREAAFTQGVTHIVGRVLKDLNLQPSEIATLGYQRLLDIIEQTCNDPWELFLDLQRFNRHTPGMRSRLQESLSRILARLNGA